MKKKKRRKKYRINYTRVFGTIIVLLIALAIILVEFEHNFIKKETQYPIKYQKAVEKYSKQYDVDKYLVYSVMKQESNFKKDAVSRAGARGLMQITEDTFNWLSVKMKVNKYEYDDLFDPEVNIMYGVFFISYLQDRFEDNRTVTAAYNAGINVTRRWLKDERYSDDGISLKYIPYKETSNYVEIVNKNYNKYIEIYEK
ncbi:MAG: lytic transglycosylase domain-containing protein [Proteocatella sp.]